MERTMNKSKLPKTDSIKKLAEFWDSHDLSDFEDELEVVAEPVFVREGGSIGAVVSMEKVLKTPVMFLGLSLPEHGYHAPNENYDWQQASGGMVAFVRYFENLSKM